MPIRTPLAGTLAVIAAFLPEASAAEERRWILDETPEAIRVVYGTPQSDDVVVGFDCDRHTRALTITVLSTLDDEDDDIRADLVLASPGGRFAAAARGSFLMMDELVLFTAETRFDRRLRAVMETAGTLRIVVLADTFEAPLAGSAAAVAALQEHCGAP